MQGGKRTGAGRRAGIKNRKVVLREKIAMRLASALAEIGPGCVLTLDMRGVEPLARIAHTAAP